jgi:hypothetical protein
MVQAAREVAAKRITFDPHTLKTGFWPPGGNWFQREIRVVGPSPDGRRQVDADAWLLPDDPDRFAVAGIDVPRGSFTLAPLSEDDVRAVDGAVRPRRAGRAIPVDDDGLRRVAELYRTAVMEGCRNPTQRVASANNVSRMTASRWLRRARDRGFLAERKAS